MEVEPSVMEVRVNLLKLTEHISHFFTEAALTPFLVDQVDEVLAVVLTLCIFNVVLRCIVARLEIGVHDHRWRPQKVWLHRPLHWDGASDLSVSCNLDFPFFFKLHNVFGLSKIGGTAFRVEATCDKSAAWSTSVPSRYQNYVLFKPDISKADIAVNARHSERSKLRVL